MPYSGNLIWQRLESKAPPKRLNEIGSYDAVVVLSGMLISHKINGYYFTEWSDPDRFFAGINLISSGKAPKLIFTRGKKLGANFSPEGEFLKEKAIQFGIDEKQIILSDIAFNTAEEAVAIKKILETHGINKVLLVTSSFHVPRVETLFSRQHIDFDTFPVDFRATDARIDWLSFLPSAGGFQNTSSGIREYIGRLYYWF